MRKFTIYNLQFTIKLISLFFTFYILHFTFYISPAYAEFNIGEKFGFGQFSSLGQIVSKLVPVMFSVAAAGVIIYFLLGAFKFLMSGGNKEAIAEGRNMITHSIIGFMILIFAFLILQFLLSALLGITEFQLFQP